MIYRKFQPSALLLPFVECYYLWHSSGEPVSSLVVESPPTGFCSIVFNFGDPYYLQNKKYDRLAVPAQFIAGQAIYSYKLFLNGIIDIAGIVFKPTGLASLFDLPTFEYTEERIALASVFKKSSVDELVDKIRNSADENEKIKLLEGFLLEQFHDKKPEADVIDTAANLIVEKNGMVDVSRIMKDVYMSRRNFERRFFKKVGLSPKYYARLRRMSYVMNLIAGKKKADWAALFTECEFYDQSHFIKEVKKLSGVSPKELKRNQNGRFIQFSTLDPE